MKETISSIMVNNEVSANGMPPVFGAGFWKDTRGSSPCASTNYIIIQLWVKAPKGSVATVETHSLYLVWFIISIKKFHLRDRMRKGDCDNKLHQWGIRMGRTLGLHPRWIGSIPIFSTKWLGPLMVRRSYFQFDNRGSIPRRVTKLKEKS